LLSFFLERTCEILKNVKIITKKILGIFKIIPLEFENIIKKEFNSLRNINIEKYKKNNLGRKIYLWDYLSGIKWENETINVYEELKKGGFSFDYESFYKKEEKKTKLEIQKINDISTSKSRLEEFEDIETLIQEKSKELIYPINEEKLNENMQHEESRIFHSNDEVVIFTPYNNKIKWRNSGGSHHFMATRYIAKKINKEIKISCTLEVKTLNKSFIKKIFDKYEIFLLNCSKNMKYTLQEEIKKFGVENKMIFIKNENLLFFLLNRDLKKDKKIIEILRHYKFYNLKEYFFEYLKEQERNLNRKI
jgi:hypothetical protein